MDIKSLGAFLIAKLSEVRIKHKVSKPALRSQEAITSCHCWAQGTPKAI